MQKLKIAVVIPKYGLAGGAEQFVLELTERLALNPLYDIHVLANKWKAHSQNVTFHKIPIISFPKFLTSISFAYFAHKKISCMGFDLIHAHDRIFRADIFTMHGIPHRIWVKEIRKKRMSLFDYGTAWLEKSLILRGNCRKFIAVSQLALEKFHLAYTVSDHLTTTIHPGVDLKRFCNIPREKIRIATRKQLGINPTDIVMLFVSMNFEHKGLDLLIASLSKLQKNKTQQNIKLLVVGKGNEKKYSRLAKTFDVQQNVIFTGVWEEHIENVYICADIFAMLSKFDTFGMSVLEAMAASLPVIVSSQVGAKDLLSDNTGGIIVELDDEKSLYNALLFLLDATERKKMGDQAFHIAQNYSWDLTALKVSQIYSECFA